MARVIGSASPRVFPCGCKFGRNSGQFLRLGGGKYMCLHLRIWKVKTEWVEEKKGSK